MLPLSASKVPVAYKRYLPGMEDPSRFRYTFVTSNVGYDETYENDVTVGTLLTLCSVTKNIFLYFEVSSFPKPFINEILLVALDYICFP
jgi:hypothetical protein